MKAASKAPLVLVVDELTESILTALDTGVSYARIKRAIQGLPRYGGPSPRNSPRPCDDVRKSRSNPAAPAGRRTTTSATGS